MYSILNLNRPLINRVITVPMKNSKFNNSYYMTVYIIANIDRLDLWRYNSYLIIIIIVSFTIKCGKLLLLICSLFFVVMTSTFTEIVAMDQSLGDCCTQSPWTGNLQNVVSDHCTSFNIILISLNWMTFKVSTNLSLKTF